MEFQGTFLGGGDHNRYFGIDEATADMVYDILKGFWTTREFQSKEEIKQVIETYRQSNFHDSMEPVRGKNSSLYSDRDPERPFSMIDFGGANGSVLYFMTSQFPEETLRYVLVEGYLTFVEDFRQHFPSHRGNRFNGLLANARTDLVAVIVASYTCAGPSQLPADS